MIHLLRSTRRRQRGLLLIDPYRFAAWSPPTPGSLYAWWDMSDSANVVLSGANVSQLTDKSGNGNHAVQATAGNQFVKSAASINGLDTMIANGGLTSFMSFPAISSNASLTIVAIVKAQLGGHVSPNIIGPATATAGSFGFGSLTGTPKTVFEVSATKSFAVNAFQDPRIRQTVMLMVWNQSTGNVLGYQDNHNLVNASTGTAPAGLSFAQIGYNSASSFSFTGNFCEAWIYASALSAGDITSAYNYGQVKWQTN